jgi:hypothetical protein
MVASNQVFLLGSWCRAARAGPIGGSAGRTRNKQGICSDFASSGGNEVMGKAGREHCSFVPREPFHCNTNTKEPTKFWAISCHRDIRVFTCWYYMCTRGFMFGDTLAPEEVPCRGRMGSVLLMRRRGTKLSHEAWLRSTRASLYGSPARLAGCRA